MKKIIVITLFFLLSYSAFSQGELDKEKKIFFRNERTWGIYLNSNGYGLNYESGNRIDAFNKKLWEIDFDVIEDTKEYSISNYFDQDFSSYVYGKKNQCFNFRYGIGKQKEIYSKFDKNSVAIRYFYIAGVSLALLKPIYYEIYQWPTNTSTEEKFDITKHSIMNILGKASFFRGFDEIIPNPGAYLKFGLSFEYSNKDNQIRAFEIGGMVQGFLRNVDIMATESNPRILFSLFINYRFGKVISISHLKAVDGTPDETDIDMKEDNKKKEKKKD